MGVHRNHNQKPFKKLKLRYKVDRVVLEDTYLLILKVGSGRSEQKKRNSNEKRTSASDQQTRRAWSHRARRAWSLFVIPTNFAAFDAFSGLVLEFSGYEDAWG